MITKDEIKSLIKNIADRTGKTQAEIAIEAKYKPKTLTQLISAGANLDKAYQRLKMAFPDRLKNSTMENLIVQLMERQNQLMEEQKALTQKQNKILEDQQKNIISKVERIDAVTETINSNVSKIMKGLAAVGAQVDSRGEVVLKSLERIERKAAGDLLKEANKIVARRAPLKKKQDKQPVSGN